METIRKDIQRSTYNRKYDAKIIELIEKGWGFWRIYNELTRLNDGKQVLAVSTVQNRVREYRRNKLNQG